MTADDERAVSGSVTTGGDRAARWPLAARLTLMVAAGTAVAAIYHLVAGIALHRGYPYDTFLYRSSDRFQDFDKMFQAARHFHPGVSSEMVYSPVLHLFMTALTALPRAVGLGLVEAVFVVGVVAFLYAVAGRGLDDRRLRLAVAIGLGPASYPVIFALDRGNLEMVVFILLAAFVYLYFERRSPWAWLPLALAIAAKYYWVTLLVIPVLDKRYRQAVLAAVGSLAATAAAAVVLVPISGYGLRGIWHSLTSTLAGHVWFAGSLFYVHHAHTYWGVIQVVNRWAGHVAERVPHFPMLYVALALALFALVILRLRRRPFEGWEKLAVLTACTLLLPFESADYVLVQWLLPVACMLAAAPAVGISTKRALLVALPLIPLAYLYFGFVGRPDVSVAVLLYPLILTVAGVTILRTKRPLVRASLSATGETS